VTKPHRSLSLIALSTLIAWTAAAVPALSPSIEADAEYLLTTDDFMDAQFGMAVEAVEERPGRLTVRTTGGEFVFEPEAGRMGLQQRLGSPREMGHVTFPPGALSGLRVERKGTGAVVLVAGDGGLRLRINGDSLLMLKTTRALALEYTVRFAPGTVRRHRGNLLILDEWGGMGSYVATGAAAATVSWPRGGPAGGCSVSYALKAGQILWLAVAPPKPFDWESSLRDRVVWHWSRQTGYPSDAQLEEWSRYGNILLQQAEMMLWKDWALRFVPRNGTEEFERVNRTCERLGMRNIVYTSPYYFLTGTGKESRAVNSFDNFAVTRFGPADSRGANWPIFLSEITRVMRDYKPDGLYFDGIYSSVVRTYLLVRKARELVGDQGLLEFHATLSPPGGGVYLPQIDTYFNVILRGEGGQGAYQNQEYLRYFVSTRNISNATGVLCNNNAFRLDKAFISGLLDANIRLHFLPTWLNDYRKEAMETLYWPALNDALPGRVEAAGIARQATLGSSFAVLRQAEQFDAATFRQIDVAWPTGPERTIRAPGVAGAKVEASTGKEAREFPGGWRAVFSPKSEGVLSIGDGVLRATARENTCAYVERALPPDTVAVTCRVRCTKQGGASWGPGLMLRIGDQYRRINVRSDNRIGVDRPEGQLLFGGYRQGAWHWIRLRMVGEFLLYEASTDGKRWRRLQVDRVGTPNGDRRLAIGKIANNGSCIDYAQTGGEGSGDIADVQIFAENPDQGRR
jgi:hypothetical protein